jgi:hypothetical protein
MLFFIEIPHNCALFNIENLKNFLPLITLPIKKWGRARHLNALICDDIRREKNGQLAYLVNGEWVVFRNENGGEMNIWQNVSQILQVTFDNGVKIYTGKTIVPNAFFFLSDDIKDKTYASHIAPGMFAKDVKKIQDAPSHTPYPTPS